MWEGPANPDAVRDAVFTQLEALFAARGWTTERGGGGTNLSPDECLAWHEFRYRSPDDLTAGWARLFVHQEGRRVAAILTFNTGRDWGSE